MIYEYNRGNKPLLAHAKSLPFLDDPVKFEEGLNLIVGPNGTGKTTLLQTLARLFFCEQQGYPKFNGFNDFSNIFNVMDNKIDFTDLVKHNSFPVFFNHKYHMSSYDEDNFEDSFGSMFVKMRHSSGEFQAYELNKLGQNLKVLKSYLDLAEEFKAKVNSTYRKKCNVYMKWLKEGITLDKSTKITILLDEPTSNMDIAKRINYWKVLQKLSEHHYQVIIAVHDVTPFFVNDNYHIIETKKDYFEGSIKPYLENLNKRDV